MQAGSHIITCTFVSWWSSGEIGSKESQSLTTFNMQAIGKLIGRGKVATFQTAIFIDIRCLKTYNQRNKMGISKKREEAPHAKL